MSNFSLAVIKALTALVLAILNVFSGLFGTDRIIEKQAAVNGSLVCTDELGRSVVSAGESEKLVGVFYFLWQGQHGKNYLYDNTKIVAANPNAINSEEEWLASGGGNVNDFHFWGEPLFGYYSSDDEWVLRKHVQMLTDAAVDFIVIDTTNAFTYSDSAKKLIRIWHEYLLDGWNVPQIAFYTNSYSGDTMNRIYDEIYNDSLLKSDCPRLDELWFRLDGKPMIIGDSSDSVLRNEVKNYFRIKANQWPNENKKKDGFPWMEFERSLTLQAVYNSSGTRIMNVSLAQHSDTCAFSNAAWYGSDDRTRSWHSGANDTSDGAMLQGYNFAEQWEFAIRMNPDVVFITGFNEWVAQRQPAQENRPIVFVDCADENASRDFEPSAGVLGDNYYMQLVNYIAKFKKSTAKVSRGSGVPINIDGGFEQWNNPAITAVYKDYRNDTADRNCEGFGSIVYTDYSGRNDILNMKVTEDESSYYFYVDTAENLTAPDAGAWMTLFINEEIAINRTAPEDGKTAVEKSTENGFKKIGDADIRFDGNKLMIKVEKSLIDAEGPLKFKWADNYTDGDVYSFYTKGDAAPYGRLCYGY